MISLYLSWYIDACIYVHGLNYGAISALSGKPKKLVNQFTFFGSNISSTECEVNIRIDETWTTIDSWPIIRKSDLLDKIKQDFFQVVAVSILLYKCTTWTLIKCKEKKLDGNFTRMLLTIFSKFLMLQPTKQPLCDHLLSISHIIQVWRSRHEKCCWRSKDENISDVFWWTFTYGHTMGNNQRFESNIADTGCSLEDLPGVINDRDGWKKSESR